MSQPLTLPDLQTAISKYGPILRIHPKETYFPCSIEYFLSHSTLIDSKNASNNITHPLPTQLPQGPADGTHYYLTIEDSVKPGKLDTAKAYINAYWISGMTYTDLQFWFFSAFNGPGTARFGSLVMNKVKHMGDVDLTPLGEHVGDWEYAAISIDNSSKEMIGIWLSEHGKNIFSDKAAVVKNFQFIGTNPVVYASLNGHANFPGVGDHFTNHVPVLGWPAGLEFDLINSTADGGHVLDASKNYEIMAATWLKEVVSPAWVGYPYRWGPEGTAITMDSETLGKFIEAALGDSAAKRLLHDPIIVAASELLHIFVKSNINGAAAPATQAPWSGKY